METVPQKQDGSRLEGKEGNRVTSEKKRVEGQKTDRTVDYQDAACSGAKGGNIWNVDYPLLAQQLLALSENVDYEITCLANGSALLYQTLPDLNWAGFYLYREGCLKLGPFQGKAACTVIAMGKGVCGTAAAGNQTVVVADVHQFPGHIACDGASNSEIVIPIHRNGDLYGVLDIDSPVRNRFSERDKKGLEDFVKALETALGETAPEENVSEKPAPEEAGQEAMG